MFLARGLFKTQQRKINIDIIQCYTPTNDSDDEEKDDFYNRLSTIFQSPPRRKIVMVMGDLNAKVGSNNTGYKELMGLQGLGEMHENGERFAELFASNSLVIGGCIFQHKRIHKATWASSDHTTEN